MKTTDKLIQECLDYKRSSQNELYHRYAPQVMSIAKRYVIDDHKAKDVFLVAFEKAFNNIQKYDNAKGSFISWLSRITINESINYIKHEKRYAFTELEYDGAYVERIEPIDQMDHDLIMDVIMNLKMPYGMIFNMVYDGYKHKEIASQLNITEATSRSYYKRSREMIQKKLLKITSSYEK